MKNKLMLIISAVILISCTNNKLDNETDIWNGAKWIALEQLSDSMKVVPGIHALEDQSVLGNKALTRSKVPMFRKEFNINKDVESASIIISGLGHYELEVNNKKIGDRFLSPGWTIYQKKTLYNKYDISENIKNGGNAIGVMVGNGFYNVNRERYRKLIVAYGYPKLIFNLTIKYKDGTIENIISDENCSVTQSPITFSSIFGGEDYDATKEQNLWSSYKFNDDAWQKPVIIKETESKLVLEKDYPLKVMQEFEVQKISKSKTGKTIYDFGQNASGIISLKVKGNRGTRIKIKPDELIDKDGNVTQLSGGGPYEFNYILKGEGVEQWQPRFTYYGFRYADVEIIEPKNAEKKTEVIEIKMLHTRNSSPTVGSFNSSSILFNKIYELIRWGMKSNMASVSTDCPHREKLGWLEQTYLIGPSIHYCFDIHKLYSKVVDDMIDAQLENGLVPDIAPEYVPFGDGFRDSPEWGSASVIIPWQLYKWYGDKQVLKKAYPMMTKYVNYLQSKMDGHILYHGLGDWYDLGPKHPGVAQLTPKALTATSIYYYDLMIIAKTAKMLGENSEVQKYLELAKKVKEAFQKKFYNSENGICSTGSQTSYAMALYTGILPKQDEEMIFKNLLSSIKNSSYSLTSGDIGYHFLVRVLSERGRSDILYKMNHRSDKPGYGYQLKKGATALTESWSALTDVSNNHMMLGHLMEWFYTGLGGISQKENSIAYKNIIIAPKPVGDIKWVNCSYNSIQGIIESKWKLENNIFLLEVTVPQNTTAEIVLPDHYKNSIIEIISLSEQKLEYSKIEEGIFQVSSGKYKFSAKL